jgi:peptide chain release factor 2
LSSNGENDDNDCYLEIHAGAGGNDSQDWVAMLMEMYQRWAESKQFNGNKKA